MSTPSRSRRRRLATAIIGIIAMLAAVLTTPAADAATTIDPTSVPVVFVHGGLHDACPPDGLKANVSIGGPYLELYWYGWKGRLDIVNYYACDIGGDARIGNDTPDTPIETIAWQLAWYIFNAYTVKGQAVDIVGASMGGIIARAALLFTQYRVYGYPSYLLVRNAVAISSPFDGQAPGADPVVIFGSSYQATEMYAGSSLLKTLTSVGAPQGRNGTRWMVIGSSGTCDIIPGSSATDMRNATRVLYDGCWTHTQYLWDWATTKDAPASTNGAASVPTYHPMELMHRFLLN